jgi:hypothetical protein
MSRGDRRKLIFLDGKQTKVSLKKSSCRLVTVVADAHRADGHRFIVRADEKLTAFAELESTICIAANCLDRLARFFPDSRR